MKKTKFVLGMLALGALSFNSCSSDDDGNSGTLAGTYDLREVNVSEQNDFDMDGTSHTNLRDESDCYDNGKLTLNSDNTLTYVYKYVLVDENLGTSECGDETFTGSWSISGQAGSSQLVEAVYVDENETERTIQLVKEGNELSYSRIAQFPDRNAQDGAVYSTGLVEYVFRK